MVSNKTIKKENGFTIIEIAIILLVAGSLLAFLGSALLEFQKKRRIALTEYRLEKIQSAMGSYFSARGKYPCPAPVNAFPRNGSVAGSPMFGREAGSDVASGAPSTDCRNNTLAGMNGTKRVSGARTGAANAVRVGSVPVRDLDLKDEVIVDGWGNRFTYAVTINQATANGTIRYIAGEGDIDIVGSSGTSLLGVGAGRADYVVISHGADQKGAQNILVGNIPIPCNNAELQFENCVNGSGSLSDNNAVFMDTMHQSGSNGQPIFDDYLAYFAPTSPDEDIPSGAVMPFNLQYCPKGWSAMEKARGRFIMSVVEGAVVTRTALDPFVSETVTQNWDYPVGQTDETDPRSAQQKLRFNIPPYVALLYCRKD